MKVITFLREKKKAIFLNLLFGNLIIEVLCFINSTALQRLVFQLEFTAIIVPILFIGYASMQVRSHPFMKLLIIELEAFMFFYLMIVLVICTSQWQAGSSPIQWSGLFSFLLIPSFIFTPVWALLGAMNFFLLKE
jgi:hypothetical protein